MRMINYLFHILDSNNDKWIINSGCSHHMNGDFTKFDKFEECDGGSIKLGNDVPCLVKGRGSLTLNDKITCDDAYWVQGLKYNLLSISQLNIQVIRWNLKIRNSRSMMMMVI